MKRIFPLGAIVFLSPVSTALLAQTPTLTDGASNTIFARESLVTPPVVNDQLSSRDVLPSGGGVTNLNTRGAVSGNINQVQGNSTGNQNVSVAGVEGRAGAEGVASSQERGWSPWWALGGAAMALGGVLLARRRGR